MRNTLLKIYIISLLTIASSIVNAQANAASGLQSKGQNNLQNTTTLKTASKEQAAKWVMQQKVLGFQENKGQMADSAGNAVPYVLFKVETPNTNIWITNTGITYQFFTIKENENTSPPLSIQPKMEEEKKLRWHRVDMVLKKASIKKENVITEGNISQGKVSYYLGHCPSGIFNVKTYSKITIKEVYKGIDWVLYTSKTGSIKYDFIVHPRADPNQIKLIYEGSGKLEVKDNQIHFQNELGQLTEGNLLCYQGMESNTITSNYSVYKNDSPVYLGAGNPLSTSSSEAENELGLSVSKTREVFSYEIGIETGNYNKDQIFIIDPQLTWSTFFGGNGHDGAMSVDTDAGDNVFVTGYSHSINFPMNNWGGAYNNTVHGGGPNDIIIMHFSNTGTLIWSTYYGGNSSDYGNYIFCDVSGNIYVTGTTYSTNFPLLARAGAYNQNVFGGGTNDAFILRFSNTGTLTWATYYGGNKIDIGNSIAPDASGSIYIAGTTESPNIPIQNWGSYNQNTFGGIEDAFILRITPTGNLSWATYYGGSSNDRGNSIACDANSNLYVTGSTFSSNFPLKNWGNYNQIVPGGAEDAFILHFTNTGTHLWSTFYGGSGNDKGNTIACDLLNNVYVLGNTNSANLPTKNRAGAFNQSIIGGGVDAFILQFSSLGIHSWGTYYGGSNNDTQFTTDNMEVDKCGNVFVSFNTNSSNLYTFNNAACNSYSDNFKGGRTLFIFGDIFIAKFSSRGTVMWTTFLGGNGGDFREALAVDNSGNLFATGEWLDATNYPLINPGGGAFYDDTQNGMDDSYIVKFATDTPTYSQSQINSTVCSPCNGSATVTVSCGESNYSYVWSNGTIAIDVASPTSTITGLCPGNYTVTATSNCNQIQIATFTITGTTCGSITASVNSATTCNSSTPCPTLTATGASGTSPYTYSWSTGATTQNISPCPSATTSYTVTVKDNTGASASSTAMVTVNPSVTVSVTPISIICNGTATGLATATGNGGTSPYTFSWSTGATTTGASSTIPNLSANTYTVTITDSKGCTKSTTTTLVSPPPLLGQFTKGTASCTSCGCQEWIIVNAIGGTPPYTYLWPDGYDKRYKNKICPDNYLIKVTDKNGCSVDVNLTAP